MLEEEWSTPDRVMSTDSCLSGGGCFSEGNYVHWEYPVSVAQKKMNINQLECFMLVVAVKTLKQKLSRRKLVVFCDNLNTVIAINSGSSRDCVLQQCLRELHKMCALVSCEVRAKFLEGRNNRVSDSLSRWHLSSKFPRGFL